MPRITLSPNKTKQIRKNAIKKQCPLKLNLHGLIQQLLEFPGISKEKIITSAEITKIIQLKVEDKNLAAITGEIFSRLTLEISALYNNQDDESSRKKTIALFSSILTAHASYRYSQTRQAQKSITMLKQLLDCVCITAKTHRPSASKFMKNLKEYNDENKCDAEKHLILKQSLNQLSMETQPGSSIFSSWQTKELPERPNSSNSNNNNTVNTTADLLIYSWQFERQEPYAIEADIKKSKKIVGFLDEHFQTQMEMIARYHAVFSEPQLETYLHHPANIHSRII